MSKDSFSLNITGSTIGAMALGPGATARSTVGGPTADLPLALQVEISGASRGQIAHWLRKAAQRIERGEGARDTFADVDGGAKCAWSLGPDKG
jgi:hypothetical protein